MAQYNPWSAVVGALFCLLFCITITMQSTEGDFKQLIWSALFLNTISFWGYLHRFLSPGFKEKQLNYNYTKVFIMGLIWKCKWAIVKSMLKF